MLSMVIKMLRKSTQWFLNKLYNDYSMGNLIISYFVHLDLDNYDYLLNRIKKEKKENYYFFVGLR